ncbi:hypothetical protein BWZ22_15185 [Seonamhaeicola sp. S2-3]|uniref:hypothetical protein n=1 Tax=Seonamhaeicola sp. S2-3 TaxID=1936081 RepID=UPI0009729E23|nr:hypothetical protein [Seonamhaeicola sp. S2-3]APY12480.1 hypothetical protein BWZ22_15185 [Seonamhaeicola sp. S2-3]
MKNLRPLIIGIIIGALATYFFCPRQSIEEGNNPPKKIVKPKGVISVEAAKILNNNWNKERKQAVDSAARRYGREKDNRWVWWPVEDVENYLTYAKHYSDSIGYNMTGLRVYLGVYGNIKGSKKQNLTTMFVVPTGNKAQSNASTLNFLPPTEEDIPIPPLNNGSGGNQNYPQ